MVMRLFKSIILTFILISTFSLLGCGAIDKKQAADVEKELQKKYNQEFKVTHIGGRYGTATNDTVTTYIHPANQEELVFKAITTKDGSLVSDSYIPSIISQSFNQILKQELQTVGIESETFTFVMQADSSKETNPDISLEEYITTYKPGYFSAHMIVKENANVTGEQFEDALKAVYQAGLKTTFQVGIRVISADEYEEALTEYKQLPEVSSSWFRDYKVIEEIDAVVDGNGYNFQLK
jgi:hypothetical protein